MAEGGRDLPADPRSHQVFEDDSGRSAEVGLTEPPSGTLAFLFTDIEGSTRLWEEFPDKMSGALARHDALLRKAIEADSGAVFKTVGDAFCAAFHNVHDAARAALAAQTAVCEEPWPEPISIRARMAIHVGTVEVRDGDYYGKPLNRVARVLATGHGGQILLTELAQELCRSCLPPDCSLRSLGTHRLRDLVNPEPIYQLCHPRIPIDFPNLKSLGRQPNNLPEQLTTFVGREAELSDLKARLGRTRMLTLTGSGGCGKTRLAVQAGSELLDGYEHGVWFVELASLADAAAIPATVAGVFGLREEPGRPIEATLAAYLRDRRLLLVLDNCEHLVEPCARLADSLLRQCLGLTILATSREPLSIAGEMTYRVPSLTCPDQAEPGHHSDPGDLVGYESVRLFLDRARSHTPAFSVTSENAPTVASVCRRLDGIPLAIELAAARVRSSSVAEVEQRLDRKFKLLTGGSRTTVPRHQTLRSLIDWSYDLLSAQEQVLLNRVSVFAGGWTLDAAEAVCSGGEGAECVDREDVYDLLTSLVDKSLVIAEERDASTRYRILETVRDYGAERLVEHGEADSCREAHLAYFADLAELAESRLRGPEGFDWLVRIRVENDNLRAAMGWSLDGSADPSDGLRIAASAYRFWYLAGFWEEAQMWLTKLLATDAATQFGIVRAMGLRGAGVMALHRSDYEAARELLTEALEIVRELGDKRRVAALLNNLGGIARSRGDHGEALALYQEGLRSARESADDWICSLLQLNLGLSALARDDVAEARRILEENLPIAKLTGDRNLIADYMHRLGSIYASENDHEGAMAMFEGCLAVYVEWDLPQFAAQVHVSMGRAAAELGDPMLAGHHFRQALETLYRLGDLNAVAEALEGRAAAAGFSDPDLAAVLWGAAERIREDLQAPLTPMERRFLDPLVAAARERGADPARFERKWREGRKLSVDEAVSAARLG